MNGSTLSIRKLVKYFNQVVVKDNTVLVVKADSPLAQEEALKMLLKSLERIDRHNIIVVVTASVDDLVAKSAAEMNKLGWYHIAQIPKLSGRIPFIKPQSKEETNEQAESVEQDNNVTPETPTTETTDS